jgi:chromosome segregation ATPase
MNNTHTDRVQYPYRPMSCNSEIAKIKDEKTKAELEVLKRKLLDSEKETEEVKKARSGAEAELATVKKWESSARHELKLTDMVLKKADEKEVQLQGQLTSVIPKFLSSMFSSILLKYPYRTL